MGLTLSLDLSLTGTVIQGGGGPTVVSRNIAAGGRISNALGNPPSGKERMQARHIFTVWQAASRVRTAWANRYITATPTFDNAGPQPYTVNKFAYEQAGAFAAGAIGGNAGVTLAGGDIVQSDWTNFSVVPGTLYIRSEIDVTAGSQTYVRGDYYSGTGGEKCVFFAPANEIDQIYGTGALATPSGGVDQVGVAPLLLIGEVAPGVEAVIGISDSKGVGDKDFIGYGLNGGGYIRRAAYAKQVGCFMLGVTGNAATYVAQAIAAGSPLFNFLVPFHNTLVTELLCNDIKSGRTAAQGTTDLKAIWSAARAKGVTRVVTSNMIPRCVPVGTSDLGTSLSGQTPDTGFGAGGQADIFNASLAGLVSGGFIEAFVDVRSLMQDASDNTKWALASYSSTLAAVALSTDTTVSLTDSPNVNDSLVASPGGGAGVQSTGLSRVSSKLGSGPYSTVLTAAFGVAQASGVAVKATNTKDYIHPEPAGNIVMAVPMAAAL
jgi:hypothetical protein